MIQLTLKRRPMRTSQWANAIVAMNRHTADALGNLKARHQAPNRKCCCILRPFGAVCLYDAREGPGSLARL